jgi:hypothetical protein
MSVQVDRYICKCISAQFEKKKKKKKTYLIAFAA